MKMPLMQLESIPVAQASSYQGQRNVVVPQADRHRSATFVLTFIMYEPLIFRRPVLGLKLESPPSDSRLA